jgi:hypothetical protein
MPEHIAELVPGSVNPLGANGIVFQVRCCGDAETVETHTIHHAHTLSPDEMSLLLKRYLKRHAEAHRAMHANMEHVRTLASGGLSAGCGCGEK